MSRVIYLEDTIKLMGTIDAKETQKLIDSNEVVQTETSAYLLVDTDKEEVIIRKTLDGQPLIELDEPIDLIVKTKVPHKWILQDTETGQIYRGTTNMEVGEQWELLIPNPTPEKTRRRSK